LPNASPNFYIPLPPPLKKKTPSNVDKLVKDGNSVEDALNELLSQFGHSSAAKKAASQLIDTLISLDSDSLQVVAGSRQDILNEFLLCAREYARVQAGLVNSARIADSTISKRKVPDVTQKNQHNFVPCRKGLEKDIQLLNNSISVIWALPLTPG